MSFFDDDPFEDIVNEFFGRKVNKSSSGNVINSEREERVTDYIEEEDFVYFVFELPGLRKEDAEVKLKGNTLNVIVQRKKFENIKDYLKNKLSQEVFFNKEIPVKIKKEMEWTFNNGVLEVKIKRK